jgi:hypothetical protein
MLALQGMGLLTTNVTAIIEHQIMCFGVKAQFLKTYEDAEYILNIYGFSEY